MLQKNTAVTNAVKVTGAHVTRFQTKVALSPARALPLHLSFSLSLLESLLAVCHPSPPAEFARARFSALPDCDRVTRLSMSGASASRPPAPSLCSLSLLCWFLSANLLRLPPFFLLLPPPSRRGEPLSESPSLSGSGVLGIE